MCALWQTVACVCLHSWDRICDAGDIIVAVLDGAVLCDKAHVWSLDEVSAVYMVTISIAVHLLSCYIGSIRHTALLSFPLQAAGHKSVLDPPDVTVRTGPRRSN